ncbi:DNA repair protein RecO [Alishewanella sp. SMS8]|uniref:DNA repair protein RecO n=1 Tax=Alishewanella sp. SMS8 TaxID=2994676 RepID=UPI002740ADA1|nr:DNA repair protein RecO [Alishewanella sp. SMS8]MDP5458591.1 DNA repair protein RecO [Alishewanella sp. SMS8]
MDAKLWPAYILHSRPFQEDKLLLSLLLPEQGRISAVARRRSGKQHHALQPFQLFSVSLTGRSDLKTVKQLEESSAASQLSGKVLFSGLYLNELICRIWPADQPSDNLFALYQQALAALVQVQQQATGLESALRQFELALLDELGVLPDWSSDCYDRPLQADQQYSYVPEQGLVPVQQGWPGAMLLALAAEQWHVVGLLPVAKQLTRQLLAPLLGNKPLASRALFTSSDKA